MPLQIAPIARDKAAAELHLILSRAFFGLGTGKSVHDRFGVALATVDALAPNTYGHLMDDQMDDAAAKLNEAFSETLTASTRLPLVEVNESDGEDGDGFPGVAG